jgi:PadR family transcriptional regulator PadR
MSYDRELLKGSTDALLLSLIRQQSMYGYQIIKELKKRSNGYFKFKEGTLYPALHRMQREGLLNAEWRRLPTGQERRYYTITAKGEKVLATKLAEWQGFAKAVNLIIVPTT